MELENANPQKNRESTKKALKEIFRELKNNDEIFDGISSAQFDYENGNDWEF